MTQSPTNDTTHQPRQHRAGLFDIRNIIGALLAIYGIVLLLMGAFGVVGKAADNPAANLWMGLALLAAGAFFLIWSRVRPIVVDDFELEREIAGEENQPGDGSTMTS